MIEKIFPLLFDQAYRETTLIVLSVLFVSGVLIFFLRKSGYYFVSAWASLKSWLFAAPILFLVFSTPEPVPLIFLTFVAIYGAKTFFQIIGMFHRSNFVLVCYAGILALALTCYFRRIEFYNLMPMLVLGAACLVPLARNSYKRMIQYISVTLLSFIFLGWSFMHLGLVYYMPNGVYQIMYLLILTEFCDNTNLAIGRYFKGWRFLPNIEPRRSVISTFISIFLTLALAGAMRQLLPDTSQKFWLTAGLVASFGGVLGDLVMTVVRRDAGVKIVGGFILGRGDFLQRMDRLIFVAPIYYYVMNYVV
ncbi:MAG: phosphatidate cytidylyltransferase [Bdellovibrionales bacterium]